MEEIAGLRGLPDEARHLIWEAAEELEITPQEVLKRIRHACDRTRSFYKTLKNKYLDYPTLLAYVNLKELGFDVPDPSEVIAMKAKGEL